MKLPANWRDEYAVMKQREHAIAEAIEALGLEQRYINHYECELCDTTWDDEWSCACDDECPSCWRAISPYASEIIINP